MAARRRVVVEIVDRSKPRSDRRFVEKVVKTTLAYAQRKDLIVSVLRLFVTNQTKLIIVKKNNIIIREGLPGSPRGWFE